MTTECDINIDEKIKLDIVEPKDYNVIMLNDDATPMEWVMGVLKEIFKHNKRFEIGWLKINPKGLMTFDFKFGDLETSYYLVRNQNQ